MKIVDIKRTYAFKNHCYWYYHGQVSDDALDNIGIVRYVFLEQIIKAGVEIFKIVVEEG